MPKSKRKKRRSKCKSGYFGVNKNTNGNKYTASISIGNRKRKSLGSSYDTAKEAAEAHDKEAIKLRRPFSSLNYPKKAPVGYTPIQKILKSNNTTGYRGVGKSGKKFKAVIRLVEGENPTYLGTFDTAIKAALAYDQAAIKAGKNNSTLNFPDGLPIKEKEKESAKDGGYLVNGFIIQSYL